MSDVRSKINYKKLILFLSAFISICAIGCGQSKFLSDVVDATVGVVPGDILVLSGGIVARTTTPFPLHQIVNFDSAGTFKSVIRAAGTELMMGMAFGTNPDDLLYTLDTNDRVERLSLSTPATFGNYINDINLSGTTMRTLASLSDGGTVVAESTTIIEKYDSSSPPARVTTNFPITLVANIMKLRKISGGRFVAITTGGTDSPRVYNNNGTLVTAFPLGLACGTNCDPTDILELKDGRFLVSVQIAALQSIELYSSNFTYIGQFFKDTTLLQNISALAQMADGSVLACNTFFSTCERLQIIGNTGTRMGSKAFIDNASLIRQPTDILVAP